MGEWRTPRGLHAAIPHSTDRERHPEDWSLLVPPVVGATMICKYVTDRWEREAGQFEDYEERQNWRCEGREKQPDLRCLP